MRSPTPEQTGIPDTGFEVQMLYGMAEPMQAAVRRSGLRLRVYAPVGELVPGMAYLVRRLLENTSNESFVRHRFVEDRELDQLLAAARRRHAARARSRVGASSRPATDPARPGAVCAGACGRVAEERGARVVRCRRRRRRDRHRCSTCPR